MVSEEQQKFLEKFGKHLQNLRKQKNLSLRKLAQKCEVDFADIKRYENGQINPTLISIIELAQGLEVSVVDIMSWPNETPNP
ncbi:MAG: helix-turn-helix transcriptional regulator [Mucilaginibacter polytrichastri]|nr:helix-turn-helix transcriptional regulator [Mucilaginibacter polytrichastri]